MTEPDVQPEIAVDAAKAFVALERAHAVLTEMQMQLSWRTRLRSLPRTWRGQFAFHRGRVSRLRAAWRAAGTCWRIAKGAP